ncbi:hypothetical protein [Actinomadura chokoriensis]|uniref:hypothetical protein n=1 Tax=Actinomadura chokoriensis TaxID=454156 RepID=UPI0031F7E5D9
MAEVTIAENSVDIEFDAWERLWTGRGRVTVPLAAITRAARVDAPLRAARGSRRGLAVSGFAKIGIWGLLRGPRLLVSARRGRPGLHLTLNRAISGDEFDGIVLSHPDASRLAGRIRAAAGVRT